MKRRASPASNRYHKNSFRHCDVITGDVGYFTFPTHSIALFSPRTVISPKSSQPTTTTSSGTANSLGLLVVPDRIVSWTSHRRHLQVIQ